MYIDIIFINNSCYPFIFKYIMNSIFLQKGEKLSVQKEDVRDIQYESKRENIATKEDIMR